MSKIFSYNLKHLRMEKKLTQEDVAEALGVTAQSVSRWENSTTLPDVMLLPEIAKLYGVTVDDLFKEKSVAYANYAQRLFSIYEVSRNPEDFLRAEKEFQKLFDDGKGSSEDYREYGILHQYMMHDCMKKGLAAFDYVLDAEKDGDADLYWRTHRQKLLFLSQMGRKDECIAEQRKRVEKYPEVPEEWISLIGAYDNAGEIKSAHDCFLKAKEKFPKSAILYVYGGDACKELGDIKSAFENWERAIALDPGLCDAKYSMGFCYEEMGEWEKAYAIWQQLVEDCRREGLHIEMQYPLELAEKCAKRIGK